MATSPAARTTSGSKDHRTSKRRLASGSSVSLGCSQAARQARAPGASTIRVHSRASGVGEVDRDLGRGARRLRELGEVGQHDGGRRRAGQLGPPTLGLAIETLALEGCDQLPVGRVSAVLVLDRAGDGEHDPLGEDRRRHLWTAQAQAGEHRGDGRPLLPARARSIAAVSDRPCSRRPTTSVTALHILLGITTVAARQAGGRGEAVAALPHAQRAGGNAGT